MAVPCILLLAKFVLLKTHDTTLGLRKPNQWRSVGKGGVYCRLGYAAAIPTYLCPRHITQIVLFPVAMRLANLVLQSSGAEDSINQPDAQKAGDDINRDAEPAVC